MPTCPAGHDSVSSDFCDVCGVRIGGAGPQVTPPAVPPAAPPSQGSPPAAAQPVTSPPDEAAAPCPLCGTAKSGRFCESCGFDFDAGTAPETSRPAGAVASGAPAAAAAVEAAAEPVAGPAASGSPAAWTAVVASDHAYYENVVAAGGPDAATLQFPGYCPERRFRLTGPEVRIGRRSESRGLHPEIDLTGPPADPGVSRLHAVLIAEPDGSWVVLDPGSENGTLVNGSEIATGVRVPLHDGDRIHLGAWTMITIRAG
jgi:FHA domain-containing protein